MKITPSELRNSIARKIKKERLFRNYTQEYLAEISGISTDLLRNIENGRNIGSLATLLKLCNALEITPNDLFYDFIEIDFNYLDLHLKNEFDKMSLTAKRALKEIVLQLDKTYANPLPTPAPKRQPNKNNNRSRASGKTVK